MKVTELKSWKQFGYVRTSLWHLQSQNRYGLLCADLLLKHTDAIIHSANPSTSYKRWSGQLRYPLNSVDKKLFTHLNSFQFGLRCSDNLYLLRRLMCVCVCVMCVWCVFFFALSPTSAVCLMAASTSRRYVFSSAFLCAYKMICSWQIERRKIRFALKNQPVICCLFCSFSKIRTARCQMIHGKERFTRTIWSDLQAVIIPTARTIIYVKNQFCTSTSFHGVFGLRQSICKFPCDNDKWTRKSGAKGSRTQR